jgi:hypothetical protein
MNPLKAQFVRGLTAILAAYALKEGMALHGMAMEPIGLTVYMMTYFVYHTRGGQHYLFLFEIGHEDNTHSLN